MNAAIALRTPSLYKKKRLSRTALLNRSSDIAIKIDIVRYNLSLPQSFVPIHIDQALPSAELLLGSIDRRFANYDPRSQGRQERATYPHKSLPLFSSMCLRIALRTFPTAFTPNVLVSHLE